MSASDIIAKQYNEWAYPKPIVDLKCAIDNGYYEYGAPHLFGPLMWPEGKNIDDLKILVAGCGTNSAAYNAYTLPNAQVVGIDISLSSLNHCQYLKEKHNLQNLTLHSMNLLEVDKLGKEFDLIICTGVLHHLKEPDEGLRALRGVLSVDGVMHLMLYGKYLRTGVYMMQEVFRMLGCQQSQEDVDFVKNTLKVLPEIHPLNAYTKEADQLDYDTEIVDTFLHPQDTAYTVSDILDFASNNKLAFLNWEDCCNYSPSASFPLQKTLLKRIEKLSIKDKWIITELMNSNLGTHRFFLCHPSKLLHAKIDFTNHSWINYVPIVRPLLKVVQSGDIKNNISAKLKRIWHEFEISKYGIAMLQHVNGQNSIKEIIKLAKVEAPELTETDGRLFFETMHDWGHLMYLIK